MEALTTNYIQQAVDEYQKVIELVNRPKRDLVVLAAVEQVKQSIVNFLAAFLAEKGVKDIQREDLLGLQKDCISFDAAFGELNFESIAAFSDDENFAYSSELEDQALNRYVETLTKTKELVVRSVSRL